MNSTKIAIALVMVFFAIISMACLSNEMFIPGLFFLILAGLLIPVITSKDDDEGKANMLQGS